MRKLRAEPSLFSDIIHFRVLNELGDVSVMNEVARTRSLTQNMMEENKQKETKNGGVDSKNDREVS